MKKNKKNSKKLPKLFIFSVRTMYEAIFFAKISKKLKHKIILFSFNEEASEYLKKKRINFKNIFKKKIELDVNKIKKTNFSKIFHEKKEFNLKSNFLLKKKYRAYYSNIGSEFSKLQKYYDIYVFQEIGGFASHLSLYDYCKEKKINHFFLEPSFFKNRFMCIKNSFKIPKYKFYNKYDKDIKNELFKLVSNKPLSYIKIHEKRYRKSFYKIMDIKNISRFFIKLYRSIILKYHYDYEYIFNYSFQHVMMTIKSMLQKFLYSDKLPGKFIYFPLHVPNDISLTLRAKNFYDQYSFIQKIINNLPKNYKLVIKEHPSFIGNYSLIKLIKLMWKNSNIIYIAKPSYNSYELIKKSSLLITINSKSGAEAIILNKPFFSFANSFYENFQGLNKISDLKKFKLKLKMPKKKNLYFLYSLKKFTFKGELFSTSPKNISYFSKFLKSF